MSWTVRSAMVTHFGSNFYRLFRIKSRNKLSEILKETPDIGDSIFALNYLYGPCYFAWYYALRSLEVEKETASQWIWTINESLVRFFPKPLLHWFAKNMYLGSFRRKAIKAERSGKQGSLHPYDWRIEYVDINQTTFGINIYECGMMKLAEKFGFLEMFPSVCRMDYLFSHYFDNGFKRTGTLADQNNCCDCVYQYPGQCEWAPEKGFIDRK
ncbi:hypothetical protein EG832_05880 [bacterium]|nr:hypothetical protein [bacterium]